MERKLKTLTTKFVTRCILVMMLALFSIGGMRAQLPYSPAHFGTGNKATIDGVKVTRELRGDAVDLAPPNTVTSANGYCSTTISPSPQYARIKPTGTDPINMVVYVFNEPVKEVYVDLIGLGRKSNPSKKGRVSFGIFCGSGGTANLRVTDVGNIGCNQGSHNTVSTGNNVAYVEGTGQNNYRVKVASANGQPFSILAVSKPANNITDFVLVELNKVVKDNRFDIALGTEPQSQTVCAGGNSVVLKASATLSTSYSNNKLEYQWQKSTNNGNSWVDITAKKEVISGKQVAFTIGNPTPSQAGLYRVKYMYAYGSDNCVMTKYTEEADVKVNGGEVTELTATPPVLSTNPTTNVTFKIKGTPNAVVTYNYGGSDESATIPSSGVLNVQKTLSEPTLFSIIGISRNSCTSLVGKSIQVTQGCGFLPDPVFSEVASGVPTSAILNGVKVTRKVIRDTRPQFSTTAIYSDGNVENNTDLTPAQNTICGRNQYQRGYVYMDSNRVRTVTYTFDKPITSVEIYLQKFGIAKTGDSYNERAEFSVNNGNISLSEITSCNPSANITITGGKVEAPEGNATNISIKAASTKPFTELTITTDILNKGYGFYIEICPTSIVTLDDSVCPTTPAAQFSRGDDQTSTLNGIQVRRELSPTGTNQYSNGFNTNYCGTNISYPNDLPAMDPTLNKITYTFGKKITSAEVHLISFGDLSDRGADVVTFSVKSGTTTLANPKITNVSACDPTATIISGNRLSSVDDKVTDVVIKVSSAVPFDVLELNDGYSTAGGYYVELCPASIKVPLEEATCSSVPAALFPKGSSQQITLDNGVKVTRALPSGIKYSNNAKYDYCNGTRVSYPNDLPWLQDSKEITYTFDQQVTSAEFYLVAFGINGSGLDKVQFITNAGNASITKVYDCNGNTANVVSNNQLISATERLVGDVAVRVTSSQPFTQIKVKDLASTGNGYFLSLCGSSVYKKPYNNSTQCGPTMPTPMFVGTTTATANGIGVTIDRPAGSELLADLNQNVTSSCQTLYKKGTTWVRNNNTVTYKFSQPVNNVELWLALMAGHQTIPSNRDVAKITTNCAGTPTLTLLSDCMGAAVVSANKIWANGVKGVDVAVKVTSDKPFTELTITDDNSTAFGYYVDLCPASIKKRGTGETDPVTITTQLTATTTACIGTSTTLAAKATLAANFSGNINYQWQKSTNNGSTWSNISGQTGSIASGANATYSFTPAASDNNTLYRVVYTYTNAGSFCGTMSLTTNATKLVANAVSSVITVNAPAYSNVAVCASATGTTTITAKATLNTGMGGTGVTYQLQYRPTATGTWVDRAIQKHTLVAGGAERILTIENVASNTGYYRVKYTSDASVCGGGESYSNIFKFDALTATNVITINPATYPNKTVCSGSSFTINAQATVATGTIANDGSGNKFAYELQYKANSSANWALYTLPNGGAAQIYSNNTKVGATRTFNISTENIATGGKFRVKYSADITDLCDDITVYSDEFTVTIDELDVTNITATPPVFKQGENTSVSFVIEGTPDAQVTFKVGNGAEQTQTLNAAGKYNVPPQTTNQTLELSVTKVKKGSCEKTYTDKKGRAEATTGACTTKPAVQYPGTAGQGQTTVMNGVTVTRNFSGKPSIYGNSDPGTYCSGTVYHYYTIIHNNDSSRFSNAVTYVFSKPVTSAEVWLMVMSSPAAGSYDEVQLSTNNGNLTFTKVYDCLGGAGAVTLSTSGRVTSKPSQVNDVAIRVTSDKPFTQLTVTDVRAAGGTSGVLVELCPTSIKPATITITTQPTPKAVCEGKNTQFGANVKVSGVPATESIPYEWQQSTNGLTGWVTAVAPAPTGTVLNNGVHTAAMTLTNVPKTNNGLYYRVIFKYTLSGASITATSTVATLTVYSTDTPTVSSTTTLCPTATPNSVSFASYVTPAAGTTLRWYATATATTSSTTAPTIDTNVTTRTAKTAYVRAINSNGCTSGVVTVTLTVNDTTAPTFNAPAALNIVCNSATATAAINTWLGTATATDACGAIATITNDYTAPANLCNVSGGVITVTFVAKDTFGNVLTKTSTIKLDTPPTVNADTFTATTTTGTVVSGTIGNVLTNDRVGSQSATAGSGGNVTIHVTHTPTTANAPVLDASTGSVTVSNNTPAGVYTISYDVCAGSACTSATVTVTVPQLQPYLPSANITHSGTQTTTHNILTGGSVNGGTQSATVGTGGTVSITGVVNPTPQPGSTAPSLNPSTGVVTVPPTTPNGVYTITYNVCTTATPTSCTSNVVTITVGNVSPTVNADTFTATTTTGTVVSGTIGNVLTNDRVGSQSATAGSGGNVTIHVTHTPTTANAPVLDASTGSVTVSNNTPAGVYTISYDVCAGSACTSATVTVTVPQLQPYLPNNNMVYTNTTTTTAGNIISGGTVGTQTATTGTGGNVTITVVIPATPQVPGDTVPTLNSDGTVTVPTGTRSGTYTITYQVCTTATPTSCITGVVTITVSPTATVTPTAGNNIYDVPTSGTATVVGSVLSNDTINGIVAATATNVTVNVTTAPVGTDVPTIGSNGLVMVPANATPGVYTYTYHICSVVTPTDCSTEATVTVTVRQPVPVLPNNNMVYTDTTTTTAGNIINGGTVGTQTATAGTGGNVTITVVIPATPQVPGDTVPTLNSDGTVTVPTGTRSGTYTITYQVCTTATPTSCITGVVTITVSTTVTPTVPPVAVTDSATTAKGTPVTINVLANDTLNGAVTPTVVTHPTNGTAVENTDGTVEYRPYTGFVGTDSFVYEICNGAGCSSATVTVKINGDIIVYNGVSLNGNDKNNHFHIGGIENYPNNKVRIYNRWGVEVFSVEGYDNVTKVFKGISDGRITVEASDRLPQGTYYYIIEYVDDHNKTQTEVGWLYLKKN